MGICLKSVKLKTNGGFNGNVDEILNWNEMKLRRLNWHSQNLEDWIELWPNLEDVNCNLAKK